MLPYMLLCYSLDYLGRQLLNKPLLVYAFFSFHPSLSRFPHRVYNSHAVCCASTPLLRSLSRLRSRPHSHVPVPISITALLSVPASVPVLILCSSTGLHLRSRFRSCPVPAPVPESILRLVHSPHSPFSFLFRSCSHHRLRHRSRP